MRAIRAVFVDRDGTIAKDVPYCSCPEDFELLPRVAEAIRLLNQHNFKVIVVTNQSGIARGYFSEGMLAKIHQKMRDELAKQQAFVDAIYYCPHHPDEHCPCRKPKPAMILQAVKEHYINLKNSFIVGDAPIDIEMGRIVGCQTVLLHQGQSKLEGKLPDYLATDLYQAVEWILEHDY